VTGAGPDGPSGTGLAFLLVLGATGLLAGANRTGGQAPAMRRSRAPGRSPLLAAAAAAAAAAVGAASAAHALDTALTAPLRAHARAAVATGDPVLVKGTLLADAEVTGFGARLLLDARAIRVRAGWQPTRGTVAVTVGGAVGSDRMDEWRAGRRVALPVVLREPQRFRNPGVPDALRALAVSGITWLGTTKSALLVETTGPGSFVSEVAASIRARARRHVRAAALRFDGSPRRDLRAGLVLAVLIGDRSGIPPEVVDRLQRAGTYHVVAISGSNIAILTFLALWCLGWSGVPARAAAALALVAIGAYGLVASGSASVARATVVAVLYLGARALDLRPSAFAVLWTALMALLVWNPLALADAGFLLTSLATVSILAAGAVFRPAGAAVHAAGALAAGAVPPTAGLAGRVAGSARAPGSVGRVTAWVVAVVVTTVVVDIALLPVEAALFSRVSLAGLVLNLVAIPLMTVVQVCGLATVACVWWLPPVAKLATLIGGIAADGLLDSARLVDVWTALSWRVPAPSHVALAAYYTTWGLALAARAAGRRHAALAGALLGGLCGAWIALAPATLQGRGPQQRAARPAPDGAAIAGPGRLTLVFLDVGQGDATLVAFPSGRAWLVDAGGIPGSATFDVGARLVLPALWSMGTRALDVMIVTHADPDHAGGAPSVIEALRPREVWEGIDVPGHPVVQRTAAAAARAGSARRAVRRGMVRRLDAVDVRVLHPSQPDWERQRVRNDDSVTLVFGFGRVRFLLPGDIGSDVERELLPLVDGDETLTTVLKVAHHGSPASTSEAFLRALRPSLAIVSAGRGNRFGHPAPAVLARLAGAGARVFGTAERGALAVSTDGESVEVFQWEGRRWLGIGRW
jgi:competence protein ComEC